MASNNGGNIFSGRSGDGKDVLARYDDEEDTHARSDDDDYLDERYVVTSMGEYLGEHDDYHHSQPRTGVELTGTELLTALDDTLTFAATTRQLVVNSVTVRGLIILKHLFY